MLLIETYRVPVTVVAERTGMKLSALSMRLTRIRRRTRLSKGIMLPVVLDHHRPSKLRLPGQAKNSRTGRLASIVSAPRAAETSTT